MIRTSSITHFFRGLIFVCLLSSQLQTWGQSVPKVSFQGVLKTASGEPVPDGEYTFIFSFWSSMSGTANSDKLLKIGATDASNPNNQWSETVVLPVAGGIYSHYLGTITPLNPLNFNGPVYLNIRVGGKDLLPRTEFTYAPFSFSTTYSQKVVCSGAVGDIKYSILPPEKFKDVNGDCWVPLDGRTLSSTDALYDLGVYSLPNAGGMFLRAQDFDVIAGAETWKPKNSSDNDPDRNSGTSIGQVQQDNFKSHNHIASNSGEHSHGFRDYCFAESTSGCNTVMENISVKGSGAPTDCDNKHYSYIDKNTNNNGIHTHNISNEGGSETRSKNLNFWIYIRIN